MHFWSLIFLYIWAGPHHLHYTALPDWAQTLGMTFSIMLWMPSWGGMINGLMTLSGAWDKLRTDPVLRMLVVSVAFYGMSTFEGPMMSIKVVNSLSHYTDWTIGHVHSGALGWVGFVSFGALYCLVPWLWDRKQLYSLKLVNWHFWIATIGIVFYISAMWVSGILQGLMWRAYTSLGFLEYSFIETVAAMHPFYAIRALGGALFVIGSLIMAYNLWMTVQYGEAVEVAAGRFRRSSPRSNASCRCSRDTKRWNGIRILLLIGILLVIAIGGLVEITPLFYLRSTIEKVDGMRPYTPLELAGRNIYVREGCYLCHSQMIRSLARRGRTLRPLFAGRGKHVRSPVPMGVEAHRAGPRPRRRQIFRRMARDPSGQSAVDRAAVDHAGLSVPRHDRPRFPRHFAGI